MGLINAVLNYAKLETGAVHYDVATVRVREHIADGRLTADDARSLSRWSREFFALQRNMHRFPGAYVEKAFNLAIKGLHYETVMSGIADAARRAPDAPSSTRTPAAVA